MEFTLAQARDLVEAFGGDEEATMTVEPGDGHSGKGLYVYATDYPEEGATLLGEPTGQVEHDRLTSLCANYREALEKYGEHSSGCAGDRFGATCTCGFEAALQEEGK